MNDKVKEMMDKASGNFAIFDSISKAYSVLPRYENIMCSISGGRDSDIVMDLIHTLDTRERVRYVWFDTGIEYQATKDHLSYLEERYGVTIERIKAIKPIPYSVKKYGQPFLSKVVSGQLSRLQKWNFQWEDEPFELLLEKYPKAMSAVKWWCNGRIVPESPTFKYSMFNINYHRYLKEFIMENPPSFKISAKCCDYAKKNVAKHFYKDNDIDLAITGIRKSEKGVRASAYKTCFDSYTDKVDQYRPLFWYKNEDEREYEKIFNIKNSDCYELWGMTRTGCVGCPFNRNINSELDLISQYEPKKMKAVQSIFAESYEYTRKYREYAAKMKAKEKGI